MHWWLDLGCRFCGPIASRWLRSRTPRASCWRGTFFCFLLLSLIYRYFVQYFLIILLILRFGICFWSHAHFCRDLPEPHFWCSRTNAICPALWTPAPSPTRSHSLQSCRITAAWWPPARAPARTCCLHSTGSWAISPRASLLQTNTTRTTNKLSLVELHFFTT